MASLTCHNMSAGQMKDLKYKSTDECVDKTKLNVYQIITDASPLILMIDLTIAGVLYAHW